jgi:hypothetical protein
MGHTPDVYRADAVASVTNMVNPGIRMLHEPDGTPVCNAAFDLSVEQLAAAAHAAGEIRVERHRGQELSTDEVLALREVTGVCDELDRLAEAGFHATVVLPLARLAALHDALVEWVSTRIERGWMREADHDAFPFVDALLAPMEQLRAEGLAAVLGDRAEAHES